MIWMQTKITSMFIYGCVIMFSSSGACGAGGGSSRHSCWATGQGGHDDPEDDLTSHGVWLIGGACRQPTRAPEQLYMYR